VKELRGTIGNQEKDSSTIS